MKRSIAYHAAAIAVVTLGLYILAHLVVDADRSWLQEQRTVLVARGLARVAALESAQGPKGLTNAFIERAASELPGFERALVLKRTKFLAHSDPQRRGKRLDRDSLADKALFDRAGFMKADLRKNQEERAKREAAGRPLLADPFPASTFEAQGSRLQAQVPVVVDGAFEALAEVELSTEAPLAPFPFVLALLAIGAGALFLPAAWRLEGHPRMLVAGVLLALMTLAQVNQLHGWRSALRDDRAQRLASTAAQLGALGVLQPGQEDSASMLEQLNLDLRGAATARLDAVASATIAGAFPDGPGIVAEHGAVRARISAEHLHGLARAQHRRIDQVAFVVALLGLGVLILGFLGVLDKAGAALVGHRAAYAYMSPAMLGLLVLVFIPVTYGLALGFYSRVYNAYEFVGFQNYAEILGTFELSDPRNFWFTLGVTVMWTVFNLVFSVSIGLFLALLLNDQMLKAKGLYRVILVVPWAIPNYVTALIWKSMFHKQFGAVNAFLANLGMEPVSWFQTFWPAFSANVTTNVWLGFPFMMVVSLGALQSIPTDLYEAARVDGASRWQRFRNITLPLLMPALVPAVIVSTVWTFNQFNVIYLVSGGAPNGATDILITEAYRFAFEADRKGFAAAYSTVIFLILLCFTLVTNRITGATKGAFE